MRIYVETYGCSANKADSEYMIEILRRRHEIVWDWKEADLVIINTCGVKGPTEEKIVRRISSLNGKRILIAGCLPWINFERLKGFGHSMMGPDQVEKVGEIVDRISKGERVVELKREEMRLGMKSFRFNPIVEIIPISQGCLGGCSYCATKFARGHLRSYRVGEIVKRAERAIKEGVKEIWLTSQDNACYGFDFGGNLAELLEEVLSLEGKFWVRNGMMNPDHVLEILDELVGIYRHPKLFKFIHVPVQSGSDDVLREMNRKYTVKEFKRVIKAFRRKIPNITISTDVICGFPTESEEDWKKTLKLTKWLEPDVLNISKFYPRPNTRASKLKLLPTQIVKERSRELSKLFDEIALERNKKWIGWEGEVLVDEGKKGRNNWYKRVYVGRGKGDWLNVKIVEVTPSTLIGEAI